MCRLRHQSKEATEALPVAVRKELAQRKGDGLGAQILDQPGLLVGRVAARGFGRHLDEEGIARTLAHRRDRLPVKPGVEAVAARSIAHVQMQHCRPGV